MDGGCRNLETPRFLADLVRRACFGSCFLILGMVAEGFMLAATYSLQLRRFLVTWGGFELFELAER